MEFLVEQRQRLGLLLGQSGTGKSLILDRLATNLRHRGAQVANLSLLGADLHEFLWLLAADLGLNPDRKATPFELWRNLIDRIAENRYQQLDTVVLLDDADHARPEVLDHLVRLIQSDRGMPMALVLVLAGPANKISHIGPRLLELAELRIDLEPWEEPDTGGYLMSALAQAGRKTLLFTDAAVLRLHARSPAAFRDGSTNWPRWHWWPAPRCSFLKSTPTRSTPSTTSSAQSAPRPNRGCCGLRHVPCACHWQAQSASAYRNIATWHRIY